MTRTPGTWSKLRRSFDRHGSRLALLGVWLGLATGVLANPFHAREGLLQLAVVVVIVAAWVAAILREFQERQSSRFGHELETGLLVLTSAYAIVAATGGPRSLLYPLVYAAVAFLMVVTHRTAVGATLLVATVALEWAIGWRGRDPWVFTAHLAFVAFFAVGHRLVLAGVVRRLRSDHERRVEDELTHMRTEARDFRLGRSVLSTKRREWSREEDELRMAHASVASIHDSLFQTVELLRTALGLHTCALLWCEGEGPPAMLELKALATASPHTVAVREQVTTGLLTSMLAHPHPELRLRALAGRRLPPYYAGSESVSDLCAVPVVDRSVLRGILCADRKLERPFTVDEVGVLQRAAEQILRIIEHERAFHTVERSKYEQERFFRASELLNEALTLEQVYQRTFDAVRAITQYDLAVMCVSGKAGCLTVEAVDGASDPKWSSLAAKLSGCDISDPAALVSIAVKNRHCMPTSGMLADTEAIVFDPDTKLRSAKSLLILPLVRGEQVLGALVLASARPSLYPAQTQDMLRVIGHQVGVSIQNAQMYRSMEMRATTDGLTGLTNHRSFQERLARLHDLSERARQPYALVLTDIDRFKLINDTHGHPVGDQVLKRVAAILVGRARKVDIVARYGGEEFVLVLPDTTGVGAERFANRLREEIAAQVMTSEHGTFKVTISMGIAEFPSDGRDRLGLIEKADRALYACKANGRNCVKRWAASI